MCAVCAMEKEKQKEIKQRQVIIKRIDGSAFDWKKYAAQLQTTIKEQDVVIEAQKAFIQEQKPHNEKILEKFQETVNLSREAIQSLERQRKEAATLKQTSAKLKKENQRLKERMRMKDSAIEGLEYRNEVRTQVNDDDQKRIDELQRQLKEAQKQKKEKSFWRLFKKKGDR